MPNGSLEIAQSTWGVNLQDFGERLRDRRVRVLGLSQADVAARAGLNQSSISRVENGGRPRDKAVTLALADIYRLNVAQTRDWLEILYGSATTIAGLNGNGLGTPSLEDAYALLERLHADSVGARRYDYFKTLHPNPLDHQPTWAEIVAVIDWLLAAPDQRAHAHLLVEFAAVLMHHLSRIDQHGRRLSLALTAADIAQEMERRTIEGWLRSDAIPWTLMEHYHDPAAARTHLVRGLSLAKELKNRDMQALALTFLGRVSLITGDNRTARANLDHARRLDPSPAVQTRIAWIEGDLAQRKKHYDEALGKYRAAAETDAGSSGGHHTTITPLLRLGDLYYKLSDPAAKGTYATLLDTMRPALTGRRLAQVKYSLARVARSEGEIGRAQALVTEAGQALATADDDPQFRQVLALFAANLPA